MPLTLNGNGTEAGAVFNRPAFLVYRNAQQILSNNTATIVQFDTETIDTDNCYDLTTHKFTPTTAGTYFISSNTCLSTTTTPRLEESTTSILKNGTAIATTEIDPGNDDELAAASNPISIIVEMNGSTDFLQVQVIISTQGGTREIRVSGGRTYFCGYKLII